MIKCLRRTIKDRRIEEINEPALGCWVRAINPSIDELKQIEKISNIPLDDLENALDKDELPRIELINNVLFTIIRVPVKNNGNITTEPLTIIIGENLLITVGFREINFLETILLDKDLFTTQKQKFLIKIFQKVSDDYTFYLKDINKNIQRKKVILSKLENKDVTELVETEETLNGFTSSIILTINVFERFITGKYLPIFQNDKELIEDMLIDTKQALNFCEINLKIVNLLRESYSAILTNNLNSVIKFLTGITIVLTIPTIIASIYGMNISLPLQNHPAAFFIVFLLTIIASIISVIFFTKKKWM